ncbi:MAG TPA: lactate racemase domain-containing protein [Roseiflexaceae bacterium]
MVIGQGSTTETLSTAQVQELLARALEPLPLDGQRVLVIIPDGTRTAPIPLLFRLLYDQIGRRVARLDYLVALGTHPPMPEDAIEKLVGVSAAERAERYPNVTIFNHRWDLPEALHTVGTISRAEAARLTDGLLAAEVPVVLNRLIFDYDQLMICGPVFPHEVAGFSGGAKYLFPGIAGADIINFTHWLGALVTSMHTIGVKDTPVRRVIHRAAEFVRRPILCLALVLKGSALHGMYIGPHLEAWSAAADLSAQLNVRSLPRTFRRVLSMPAPIYDDLWTAAKAMYKTEPIVADGGEVIIYAPHITEISYTHGPLIDEVGYHVRDYFVKQWERFKHIPGGILAHSTHVKGKGSYDAVSGVEMPRIQVTLATAIPEERCRRVNLGYADYRTIDPQAWAGREAEGILLVEHAGEMLYRGEPLFRARETA